MDDAIRRQVKNPGPEDPVFEEAPHSGAGASPPWPCKSEARNSKLETISKDRNSNDQNPFLHHPFSTGRCDCPFLSLEHLNFEFV